MTVLTSEDQAELNAIASPRPGRSRAAAGAPAKDCGLPGVVCSAHEIAPLRKAFGSDFLLVVPGIRPAGASLGDQKRVMTPAESAQAGAQYIVVGRPILAAADPAKAAKDIQAEIQGR